MFCKNCGSQIDDYAAVCPRCGIPTNNGTPPQYQQQKIYCRNCGNQINPGAPVCVHCGLPTGNSNMPQGVYGQPVQQPTESVNAGFVILSVLVPLFGIIFGAVKMGSGQRKTGQVYLWVGIGCMVLNLIIAIISWATIPAVWWNAYY